MFAPREAEFEVDDARRPLRTFCPATIAPARCGRTSVPLPARGAHAIACRVPPRTRGAGNVCRPRRARATCSGGPEAESRRSTEGDPIHLARVPIESTRLSSTPGRSVTFGAKQVKKGAGSEPSGRSAAHDPSRCAIGSPCTSIRLRSRNSCTPSVSGNDGSRRVIRTRPTRPAPEGDIERHGPATDELRHGDAQPVRSAHLLRPPARAR